MGHRYESRFVTVNAPPMTGCIQKAELDVFKPQRQFRAIKASFRGGATRMNYRLQGDGVGSRPTSTLAHYGKVTGMVAPGVSNPLTAHRMTTFVDHLTRSSDGNREPFE